MLREFIVLEVGCKATWCNMLQYKKKFPEFKYKSCGSFSGMLDGISSRCM